MAEDLPLIRETVGVFTDLDHMQEAINQLEVKGFERRHISVLGSEEAVKDRFGAPEVPTRPLEDDPDAPRASNVKLEEMGIGQGALVGTSIIGGVAAAAIAAGGLIVPGATVSIVALGTAGGGAVGAVLAKMLGDKYQTFFEKQIDNGGLLVWVRTPTHEREEVARHVMEEYGARDIHSHDIPVNTFKEHMITTDDIDSMKGRLAAVTARHEALIADDTFMHQRMEAIEAALEQLGHHHRSMSEANARAVDAAVEEAIAYARNMAAEEQAVVSESHEVASGEEETEAMSYHDLADDLRKYVEQYEDAIMKPLLKSLGK